MLVINCKAKFRAYSRTQAVSLNAARTFSLTCRNGKWKAAFDLVKIVNRRSFPCSVRDPYVLLPEEMLNAVAWTVVSRSSSKLAKVLLIVMMDVDDVGSSANEQSLLDDHDDVLLQAIEESRRLYQEEEEEHMAMAPLLSDDLVYQGPEARGFDLSAGRTWMYPTNYPVRTYQLQMVKSALFHNTLVCLPTGLGKTFIAAVVMYNFYRWYPQGKVIFMAPTRPLVHQQIDACYRVAGVPSSDTAEMTGNLPSAKRAEAWRDRRLFFLTPHVVSNDIDSGICPLELIKCVVVDEAHKATGNYSYCQVVNKLMESGCVFRVLALSATPGSDLLGVQQVVDNLRISRLELRSEESLDVAPYVHRRKVETVTVSLTGYIKDVQERFFGVIDSYMRNLLKHKVLYGSIRSLSKFRIFKFRDEFRSKPPPNLSRSNFQFVEADFAVCISLYHALELLSLHGLRSFVKYLEGVIDDDKGQPNVKARLSSCGALSQLLDEVRERLGTMDVENPNPDVSLVAPDGSFTLHEETVFSHPKLEKLREVVVQHFESHRGEEGAAPTRVMVFCQYRETVVEICHILKQYKPLIKPMSFVGQAGKRGAPGFTQKQQIAVVEKFRSGGYNTLVSTCVGEEGLDIGDVDLIVCFDCHSSPVRLVQRMGRTGRKRDGRIVMLMTEGAELQKYRKSVSQHRSVSKDMVQKRVRMAADGGPRMVPHGLVPSYHEIHVTVPEEERPRKGGGKGRSMDLKALWGKNKGKGDRDRHLGEPVPRMDRIPQRKFLSGLEPEELERNFTHLTQDGSNRSVHKAAFSCASWTEPWKQKTFSVGHSSLSEDLIHLASLIASKKEDLPPQTQTVSRARRMQFSDLRTAGGKNKKRKRSSSDPKAAPPCGVKRQRGGGRAEKRPAPDGPCGGEAAVFKVPRVSKKEAGKVKGAATKDLRSYYRSVVDGAAAEEPAPPRPPDDDDDVVVIENDDPPESVADVAATVPHQEVAVGDSEIQQICPAVEDDPEELPRAVTEVFDELKAMLKLDVCRDSRCPVCCPLKCHVPPGASHPMVTLPSDYPDVDQLLAYLTPDNIDRQRAELLKEEEPPTNTTTTFPPPSITLDFRLFDNIDAFLSGLDDSVVSDPCGSPGDRSFDCLDSSINERTAARRSSHNLSEEEESECGKGTETVARYPGDPTRGSSTVECFPKLNFDTTNAIDQLFDDLDCEEEDGNVSPTLCYSSGVIRQLSQAVREASTVSSGGPPMVGGDGPSKICTGIGVTGRLSRAASRTTLGPPKKASGLTGSSTTVAGEMVSPKLCSGASVSRCSQGTDSGIAKRPVDRDASLVDIFSSTDPFQTAFLDDETVSPVLRSSGLMDRLSQAAAVLESPRMTSFLADSSDSPVLAGTNRLTQTFNRPKRTSWRADPFKSPTVVGGATLPNKLRHTTRLSQSVGSPERSSSLADPFESSPGEVSPKLCSGGVTGRLSQMVNSPEKRTSRRTDPFKSPTLLRDGAVSPKLRPSDLITRLSQTVDSPEKRTSCRTDPFKSPTLLRGGAVSPKLHPSGLITKLSQTVDSPEKRTSCRTDPFKSPTVGDLVARLSQAVDSPERTSCRTDPFKSPMVGGAVSPKLHPSGLITRLSQTVDSPEKRTSCRRDPFKSPTVGGLVAKLSESDSPDRTSRRTDASKYPMVGGARSPKHYSSGLITRLSQAVDSPERTSCRTDPFNSPTVVGGAVTRPSQMVDSPKRVPPPDPFESPTFAAKFLEACNDVLPACSTPKQVKPAAGRSRLSRLRRVPPTTVVSPSSSTTVGGSSGRPVPDPKINFTLFLDDLLFEDDPAPEAITPIRKKAPEGHQEGPHGDEVSSPDDSIRPLKRRRALVHLSPTSSRGSKTPSPRRSCPARGGVDSYETVNLLSSEDEDFIPNVRWGVSAPPQAKKPSRDQALRAPETNAFIQYEAEVSRHDALPLSEDEEGAEEDDEDRRFVNDFPTQASPDMQAEYLRSVRSPPAVAGGGRFKFKVPTPGSTGRGRRREDVLSDPEESYEDSYERDSFCVDDEEHSTVREPDTLGEITVLEACLEEESPPPRRAKKAKANGWRRIRAANSSDSD